MRAPSIEHARVVAIFPGALGDLLLALPALRVLRSRHAGAHLTLVVNDWLRPLARCAAVADAIAALDDAAGARLFAGEGLPPWLEGRPAVYSWLGAGDDALRGRLAAAASQVQMLRVERGPGAVHATVAYARALGARESPRALVRAATLVPPASAAADGLLARFASAPLALHPGAGARAKRWDVAGFVQVARWWQATGGAVVVVAGPAEGGEALVVPGASEAREWPLPDLAALLARAALYVGNDSGVSHLAGAVGATGVVLFGASAADRWRPLGGALAALQARTHGPDGIPLTALPAARVIAACRRRFTLTRGRTDTSVRR